MLNSVRVALALALTSLPATASAFAPNHDDDGGLTLADGRKLRPARAISWQVPAAARPAYARFLEQHGAGWRASFDLATGVPQRIYGAGIPAPGASLNPALAVAAAKSLLLEHLDLLAPGAELSDLELVANDWDDQSQLRTLGFEQRHRGARVKGAQVNLRIKNDRIIVIGSEALPQLDLQVPANFDRDAAARRAAAWMKTQAPGPFQFRRVEGPFVLPIFLADGTTQTQVVVEVELGQKSPSGRWLVYLDAHSLTPVGRESLLRFASGEIRFNTPDRYPRSTRSDKVAPRLTVGAANTDANGVLSWAGTDPLNVTFSPRGPEVTVINEAGALATFSGSLADGGTLSWDERNEELVDAQLNAFIAGTIVRNRGAKIAPNLGFVTREVLQATVNIAEACNAFSDGQTINFFVSSRQCENTARIPDVVYHETGHSIHANAIIRGVGNFDTALSEGISDYLSATITGDHGMARGFFYNNQPLRDIDEANDAVWPEDVGEPHTTGIIIGGTLWDLRKALITKLGEEAGIERADFLWYQAIRRSSDIPSSYAEVLAGDDDDGNLMNGTPNQCEINEAFARHGLADPSQVGPPLGTPVVNGEVITVPVATGGPACPGSTIGAMTLKWQLRGNPQVSGTVALTQVAAGYEAAIPPQAPGSVLQYQLEVTLGSGDLIRYPDNAADPWYERFVGEVTPLYCTDFETDPGSDFTHALLAGQAGQGADDWIWGTPAGTAGSGDPSSAYSGTQVYGNDLGGGNFNGKYQPGKTNALTGPRIDVQGHTNVRLQYRRWLTVEDGDFDQARITSNGAVVWSNFVTGTGRGSTHHEDKEWRFHDVDLSATIQDGAVQVAFVLQSDAGLEFGGWTVDDFCVVAFDEVTTCGNGQLDGAEACDDGNQVSGDGCENDCSPTARTPACGDGQLDPGEACDDGNLADGDGCQANCSATPVQMMPDCASDPASCAPNGNDELTQLEGEEGCGCTATGSTSMGGSWAVGLLIGLALTFRRRR